MRRALVPLLAGFAMLLPLGAIGIVVSDNRAEYRPTVQRDPEVRTIDQTPEGGYWIEWRNGSAIGYPPEGRALSECREATTPASRQGCAEQVHRVYLDLAALHVAHNGG